MQKEIVRVENPVFMSQQEIRDKYWGKQVLMTNVEFTANHSGLAGGVVRFWGSGAMMDLWRLLDNEYSDGYGSGTVKFMGDIPLNIYVGGDAS